MQYFLKTGFGESTDSCGGTRNSLNSGLGQGNDASPPGFPALSPMIINAYHCISHGAKILLLYARRLFHLTAVIYVNNTDLLRWPAYSITEPEELIAHVQRATADYGQLVQASGREEMPHVLFGIQVCLREGSVEISAGSFRTLLLYN
jgi:hypothetical protein